MKIIDIIIEPNKIYTSSNFKLKVKASGIYKTYKYKDYQNQQYIDYTKERYKDIKMWEEI